MATRAEQEKEYQDILKVSKSLLGDISDMIDKNEKKTKDMSDTQRSYNALLKDRINEAGEYEDIEQTIANLIKDNQSYNATVNKQLKDKRRTENGSLKTIRAQQEKQNAIFKTTVASLQAEEKFGSAIQTVDASAQDLSNTLQNSIDGFMGKIGNVPVFGGMLEKIASGPMENLKGAIGSGAQAFTTSFGKALKGGKTGMQAFAAAGSSGMSALTAAINPVGLAILAVVAIIGAGLMAFKKLEDATKAFREETGLLRSQTDGLDTSIMKSYKTTVALGASMEDVSKAAADFTNQFEGLVQPSEAVLTSVVALNKNMGITTANAVGANEVFQNMAGLSAEQAQYQVEQVALASQLAGVAPDKVMADIATSAEVAANYFQGSVGNLTKAAIQAAKMGTSLKQAADVSDNLLDFENSITAELEASAMLGRSINFNKARELAAQGDIVGAQQSVLDNLEKTVDLNNVNKFQLDAIAKASGMPVAEIQKQLNLRKQFGKLDADQMKAAEQLLASGKELKDIGEEELAAQTEQVIANQQMQSEFDKMANQLSAVGSEILMAFMPIGKMIMGILTPIMQVVKGFFKPIGNAIDGIMKAFEPISGIFKDIFGDGEGVGQVFEVIGSILSGPITFAINLFSNGLKMVLSLVSGVYDVFKGIFTGDFSLIADGLMSIGEGILRFFYSIPVALYETVVDIFPAVGTFISDTFSAIWDYIKSLFDFSSIFSGIGSFFGFGGGDEEEQMAEAEKLKVAGSINDGIVQDGNIISTNPEDTLIATKEPNSLFGDGLFGDIMGATPLGMAANAVSGLFGGGGGRTSSNAELLAKMDILIEAVRQSGNISMDGKLLTDGVQNVVEKKTSNSFGLV